MDALRLVRPYRGYKSGETIRTTSGLAEHLIEAGIAVREAARPLLDSDQAERAVAAPAARTTIETR